MNRRNNGMPRRSVRLEHGHNNREVIRNDNYFNDLSTRRTNFDMSNTCPKGYTMSRSGTCVEMGGGTGPVGFHIEECFAATQTYQNCATGGGPGPCGGSEGTYGDCTCTTQSTGWMSGASGGSWGWLTGQNVGSGNWFDSATGGSAGQSDQMWYNNLYCMCTPGPSLMSDAAQCRQGAGYGPTPGGGAGPGPGTGRQGGAGRYQRGGRVGRRR